MPLPAEVVEVPAMPCACCPAAAETRVWGFDVCYPCVADWNATAPNCGDVERSATEVDFEVLDVGGGRTWRRLKPAAEVAAFEAFTKRWAAGRRAKARAA